jgi:hypothetical protein
VTDAQLARTSQEDQELALLTGRRALWALFALTMLGAAFSVILLLPNWMGILDPLFVGSMGLALCSTASAFLAPNAMRARVSQQLAESEAHRRALLEDVKTYRELLASIPRETKP